LYYDGEIKVYENKAAYPRAYLCSTAILSPSPAMTYKLMFLERFDPRKEVILEYASDDPTIRELLKENQFQLEENDGDPLRRFILRPQGAGDKVESLQEAKIINYEMDHVVIEASLDQAGFLVLSDTNYPGWKAYVNGKETSIFQANYFLRGIPLKPGKHTVEFRYVPGSFLTGVGIAVMVLLGWAGVVMGRRHRGRVVQHSGVRAAMEIKGKEGILEKPSTA
jgi:hypothetical protein